MLAAIHIWKRCITALLKMIFGLFKIKKKNDLNIEYKINIEEIKKVITFFVFNRDEGKIKTFELIFFINILSPLLSETISTLKFFRLNV